LLLNVIVAVVEVVKLFHVIPSVAKVQEASIVNVEPVVVTVPAVYVKVLVEKKTAPLIVIVPSVFIVKGAISVLDPLQIPVPFIIIAAAVEVIFPDIVKLPPK
jgi:hypothetical protein